MIIVGTLDAYGFMMANSPPKLLADFNQTCKNGSYMTLLNIVQIVQSIAYLGHMG